MIPAQPNQPGGGDRMREFLWDCPKCGARNVILLDGDSSVDIRCKKCGWDLETQRGVE